MSDHWKSLADLLGAPGLSRSTPAEDTNSTPPAAPAPVPPPTAPLQSIQPQVGQPQFTQEAQETHVPAPIDPPKAKKKSSWEMLASLFNIAGEPKSEQVDPASSPTETAAPAEISGQTEVSIFNSTTNDNSNPALTEMFGKPSSKPHEQWGKPRKMVDDLGWDDEEPVRTSARADEEDRPTGQVLDSIAEEDDLDIEEGEDSGETPVRRSRRRRRRRGGRNREEGSPTESGRESSRAGRRDESVDEEADLDEFPDAPLASDDPWDDQPARPRLSTPDAEEDNEADAGAATSERRSRRRRRGRGGRGRDRDTSRTEGSRTEIDETADDDVDIVNRELLNEFDDEPLPDAIYDELPTSNSDSDDGSDSRRRRRRKRNRGGKPQLASSTTTGEDSLEEDHDHADSDEASTNKHRNIPTWDDSLSSIIEANIENHRRNEGRGGYRGGGGGRNRGRK